MKKLFTQSNGWLSVVCVLMGLMLVSGTVHALDIKENTDISDALLIIPEQSILVQPSLDGYFHTANERMTSGTMLDFYRKFGEEWDIQWDTRSSRPELISGRGIPLLPGSGNSLTMERVTLNGQQVQSLSPDIVSGIAREFLSQNPEILRVNLDNLVMNDAATRGFGENNRLWFVHFDQFIRGVQVKDADIFLRINAGNITQLGAHRDMDVDSDFDVQPAISESEALERSVAHTESAIAGDLDLVKAPALYIISTFSEGRAGEPGEPYTGIPGQGYLPRLVWEMRFRIDPYPETWYSLVDAKTGEILHFRDSNMYETVHGGVYPVTNAEPELDLPFPYAATSQGTTSSGGYFDYTGGSVSCPLNGQYVRISDNCGSINLSANGDLDFGMSSGTDCTTPGVGGSGNTHAARSCFYHISQIKFKARGYLPSNSWLQGNVQATVNINDTCNAYWNGSSVNFFKSGGGCSNTGELASVFLHEWGHGLDDNTGTSSAEMASAEALADSMSFLQTHVGCIGHNFRPGTPCSFGCDSSCTGVRDASVRPKVSPANIEQSPADCDRWSCPYYGYEGIMGYEGHCEALIAAGAVYDAAVNLAQAEGGAAGWALANRIYFETMGDARAAYQVQSGGTCNPSATVNGCGSQNWYTVWSFADDDNGNLADGTPHAHAIFDAFSGHGIACSTALDDYTICPDFDAPTLTVAPGDNSATLTWNAVAGASSYIVYRNTLGCEYEMNIIGTTGATQYTDDTVANDYTYYYAVQVTGANDACRSEFSECREVLVDGCINPPVANAGADQDACPGDAVTLGGNPTATSGTPPFSYLWTPGNYTGANPTVSPNQTTTFTVTVTDSMGCVGQDTVTVTMDAPIANAGFDKFTCAGYCVQIGADPVPGYTYSWSPQTGLDNPNIANPTACVTTTTQYTLTVTASGFICDGQDWVTVNVTVPTLVATDVTVVSDSGDGDGSLEAGERATIRVSLLNNSFATAYDVSGMLVSADPYIHVVSGEKTFGTLTSFSTANATFDIVVDMLHDCPDIASILLDLDACGGGVQPADVELTLGQPGGLETIYSTGFEASDDEGWTHVQIATQDDWQRDTPSGTSANDPSTAYEGTKIWGNDLGPNGWDGDYKNNVNNYLLSPAIDCSGKTGIRLQFMRWLTVEEGQYDQATIYVNDTPVWENQEIGDHLDTQWTPVDMDISAIADNNPAVYIKFALVSDAGVVYGGWNIDQLKIIADAPPECDTFECEFPSADAGNDFTVSPGSAATLDGSNSTINGCVAGIEYRWSGGNLGAGAWSANPVIVDHPTTATTYSLDIRCTGSPAYTGCQDSDTVTVYMSGEPTPTAVPPTITPPPATPTPPPPTPTSPPGQPTYTPPPTTPTATPQTDISTALFLTQAVYHAGDRFVLTTQVSNPGSMVSVDEYLLLSISGSYWFYPSWTQNLDYMTRDIDPGDNFQTVFDFFWPEVDGSLFGIDFIYLLAEPGTYIIVGNVSTAEFGYE